MRTWANQLQAHTHDYMRRGGKQNRKKQVSLIIKFLEYTDSTEKLTSLDRLGKRQVINFWKSHRHFTEKVAYDYWLGICKLWEWIGKNDAPPKPFKITIDSEVSSESAEILFSELSHAIKAAREAKKLSVEKLANLSGCEAMVINEIESGIYLNTSVSEAQNLLKILNIRFSIENCA